MLSNQSEIDQLNEAGIPTQSYYQRLAQLARQRMPGMMQRIWNLPVPGMGNLGDLRARGRGIYDMMVQPEQPPAGSREQSAAEWYLENYGSEDPSVSGPRPDTQSILYNQPGSPPEPASSEGNPMARMTQPSMAQLALRRILGKYTK